MDNNSWLVGLSVAMLCLVVLLIIGGNQGIFDPLFDRLTRRRKTSSDKLVVRDIKTGEVLMEFPQSGDTARVIVEKPHKHFWRFESSETYRQTFPFKSWYGQTIYNFSCRCGETHTLSKKDFWGGHGSS